MDRLIYDETTLTIIARITNCENTSTGTSHAMVEDTPGNIDRLIDRLKLKPIKEETL